MNQFSSASAQSQMSIGDAQEKIEIFISCRKLKNMDILSLSDPQVRVYIERQGKWEKYGETEMIDDNLNPDFAKTIIMDYHFETKQKLKFEIVDIDGPGKWDMIGSVETTLGELVGAKNQTSIFDIKEKKAINGKLILRCESVKICNDVVKFRIIGEKLISVEGGIFGCMGFSSRNNPFVSFFRSREDGAWVKVHETEIIKDTNNPKFKEFEIKVQSLCNGDLYRPIKLECQSRSSFFKNKLIGQCEFNLKTLVESDINQRSLILSNNKKANMGTINFAQVTLIEKPAFLDYIYGGVQLNVIVGIDFTGSNGHPSSPESLHAIKYDGSLNDYQKAITSVCEILLNYDHDKMIPVYGFGAKLNYYNIKSTTTNHCFAVNKNNNNPYVNGLKGIMDIYAECLKGIELSGPTLFTPLITETMKIAQKNKDNGSNEYSILLILTDGEIHDMEPTINCLINSAKLPLSIIIIGIGKADFGNMERLDGDEGLYNSQGVKAQRDLVQFVPIREYQNSQERLAAAVLEEIPNQFLEYMASVGIKPRPPIQMAPEMIGSIDNNNNNIMGFSNGLDDIGIARQQTLVLEKDRGTYSDLGNIGINILSSSRPFLNNPAKPFT